jgi:hypothetical protein
MIHEYAVVFFYFLHKIFRKSVVELIEPIRVTCLNVKLITNTPSSTYPNNLYFNVTIYEVKG